MLCNRYGYPDYTYLSRVKRELAAKGISVSPAAVSTTRTQRRLKAETPPDRDPSYMYVDTYADATARRHITSSARGQTTPTATTRSTTTTSYLWSAYGSTFGRRW